MAIVERKLYDRKEVWFHICKKAKRGPRVALKKPHRFAYLKMKNSIFARFARAFFIF